MKFLRFAHYHVTHSFSMLDRVIFYISRHIYDINITIIVYLKNKHQFFTKDFLINLPLLVLIEKYDLGLVGVIPHWASIEDDAFSARAQLNPKYFDFITYYIILQYYRARCCLPYATNKLSHWLNVCHHSIIIIVIAQCSLHSFVE